MVQPGQIINMISNDIARIDELSVTMAYFVIAPLQSMIIVCIVWSYLGWSTLAGVAILMANIPFQSWTGNLFARIRYVLFLPQKK